LSSSSAVPSQPDILARIVASKEIEVGELRPRAAELRARAGDAAPTRGFAAALRAPAEVRLLAEIKRRSPSAGPIRPGASPQEVAAGYAAGGAAALSVLTDREYFDGSLAALQAVRAVVDLPLLRKDFTLDPLQVWEARAAGADAVLLIVRILDDARLRELLGLAADLGLDRLVEVPDASELERALQAGATLVGVNNRDLRTFRTDLDLTLRLAPRVPAATTLVAESGIRTADDVARLGAAGVDAVLVGESLMRQEDLRAAVRAIVGQPKREGREPR
jgi:indole-3-glycerol phosphate synthase